jgi:selenocysteine-specific elongation factor
MRVIGTAGHVDHGKSTLVKALTGIDPDRLKEEKEREMTIDLGFAWLTLPSGEQVGIVDVPGHLDFIRNMLAGVGGIDATLFVVAADEGVMPQTREHLAIIDLLKIPGGVVALTKADLAGESGLPAEEWLELVSAEIAEAMEGTTLEGAPIVPVSARTGEGLQELLAALDKVMDMLPPRRDLGRPRLPIDRVFTIAGFGTVVTGTLSDGSLKAGQEVEIVPAGRRALVPHRARIRGLQTHKEKVEVAVPGSRVAINLSGVSTDELRRGDVVTLPGWLRATPLVDAHLNYLADAPRPLRHNQEVEFFAGAVQVMAHVRLLDATELVPESSGWVQFRLREPVPVVKGDRYIIRQPSPSTTLGGGVIMDPQPGRRHRRFRPEVLNRLATLAHGTPQERLLAILERRGPMEAQKLIREVSRQGEADSYGQAVRALQQAVADGQVLVLGTGADSIRESPGQNADQSLANSSQNLILRSQWEDLSQQIVSALETYHREYPLRGGMPREELKSRLHLSTRLFNELLAQAEREGQMVAVGEKAVRLPTHQVFFDVETQRRIDTFLALFAANPYSPPSVGEAERQIGAETLNALVESGRLVKVGSDVLFLRETYETIVERVVATIQEQGSITVAQVRDLFGTSRKYALALMEHLDERKITVRVGDERVLRS